MIGINEFNEGEVGGVEGPAQGAPEVSADSLGDHCRCFRISNEILINKE